MLTIAWHSRGLYLGNLRWCWFHDLPLVLGFRPWASAGNQRLWISVKLEPVALSIYLRADPPTAAKCDCPRFSTNSPLPPSFWIKRKRGSTLARLRIDGMLR